MNLLEYYKKKLGFDERPDFLDEYINIPAMKRLKDVGYFCGMDYASKNIYSFKEYISRYDHSLTTALMTWLCTGDKVQTLAALYHDIGTPCFSHTIDYLNNDYQKQESTEEYNEKILRKDRKLKKLLKKDHIDIEDVINFKKYSIVDIERPKLCADRIDGIILTGISWTKGVLKPNIDILLNNMTIYQNEDKRPEIGFSNRFAAFMAVCINSDIDELCQSKEDFYMMDLLASIVKKAIERGHISYDELYIRNETDLMNKLKNIKDEDITKNINDFENIKKEEIPKIKMPKVKKRTIRPLVDYKRMI
ncbi:MAG: HD domain-containing protein [Bacilli bacterium]|nr:HD domain-containing protein [Bacilli bacterium]